MILTRSQFIDIWDDVHSTAGGPLWAYEDHIGVKCKWFIQTGPIPNSVWKWCKDHCRGTVICFSSDLTTGDEWWGFTDKNDIAWWILRWV